MIQLTRITTKNPSHLSKSFELGSEGKLVKVVGGQMRWGFADQLNFQDIEELLLELQNLKPSNAFAYGITLHDYAKIVTKKILADTQKKNNGGPPVIARTRDHFTWPQGPGVWMLDFDPPEGTEPLSGDQFRTAVYSIVPSVSEVPHVLMASCSSFIFNNEELLIGAKGWRMLVIVEHGTDIPRAGADFIKRCWLQSLGYIAISKAGTFLERALVDAAVWQPERLDFCGGALCEKPLEQRRPEPQIFNPDAEPLDTAEAIKPLSLREESKVADLIKAAKKDRQADAQEVRDKWVDVQVKKRLKNVPKKSRESAEPKLAETYKKAVDSRVLLGDFVLQSENGKEVTVSEMLDNPDQWHGKKFQDPLEPDYQNDKRIAWANLNAAGRPYMWSHAHGGMRFQLHRVQQTIEIIPGDRVRLVEKSLQLMKINGGHFVRGGEIVTVSATGEVLQRGKDGILYDLDGLVRWRKYDARNDKMKPVDCKLNIATGVLAAKASWGLSELTGVATAPILDPKIGRMIEMDGFDKQTGLLLIMGDVSEWPGVPKEPDAGQVEAAIATLWKAFSKFPFDNPVSRGVMLSALLTCAIRPLLPTAPAHAFDAPTAGSGKTFLAKSLAELSGEIAAMLPDAADNDEMRKRILALLRENRRVIVIDNVVGQLDSPALCAMLTAEIYSDRVLGVSETVTVPTRTLTILTGNNICLRGDLCRRVLMCRIDPGMEQPWKRAFSFDPVEHCKTHRLKIIVACLTVLRAGLQEGPLLPDRTASFETWSDSVRRTVAWVGEFGFMDVEDPIKSIDKAYDLDPETQKLSTLLGIWWEIFADDHKTVGEVISDAKADGISTAQGTLFAAVDEIAGERGGNLNPRRLGRWIERQRGRIIDGMSFETLAEKRHNSRVWYVKKRGKQSKRAKKMRFFDFLKPKKHKKILLQRSLTYFDTLLKSGKGSYGSYGGFIQPTREKCQVTVFYREWKITP